MLNLIEETRVGHPIYKVDATIKKNKWFKGIDSIRFILALIVVLGHYKNPFTDLLKASDNLIVKCFGYFLGTSFCGVAAVLCFFIISGFVIHYPNRVSISDLKQFYIRRYIRVLFPLVLISTVSLPFNNPESAVVWSLYCELIYYTIYPILAAIKVSWRSKIIVSFILCIFTVFVGAINDVKSLIFQTNINYNGNFWQLGTSFTWLIGLPSWLLGVELANKIDEIKTTVSRNKIYAFRVLVFLLSVSILILRFHLFVSYIISLTLFTMVFYKWIKYEICYYKQNIPFSFIENLGKFSYSLYLTHPLAFISLSTFIELNVYSYFLYLVFAIVSAYFFYLTLERPSHKLAQKLSRRKTTL